MYYHPPFVHKLKEAEVKAVQAHEVMHCVFKHFLRVGHRDRVWWNIAGDFVINLDLKKAGFQLPGIPFNMASKPGTEGHLYDEAYEGMSTEEVYEKITENLKKIKVFCAGYSNQNDIGGCGSVVQPQGGGKDGKDGKGEAGKAEQENLARDWDTNIRMAIGEAMKKNAGTLPGHLKRLVEEMNKPYVNWRDQFRDFCTSRFPKDFSWSRPNRRAASSGLLLPGLISESMQKLVCIFDTSGSVGVAEQKQYGGEAMSVLDDGICDQLVVIYTDTAIQRVEEFQRGEEFVLREFSGGGTDFKEVMDYVAKEHYDAEAIVFLTDMCTCSFGEDPGIPVLWGATGGWQGEAPFGKVINVNLD